MGGGGWLNVNSNYAYIMHICGEETYKCFTRYHFKDGVKDNEPTFFSWSSVYDFEDPNKKKY